MSFDEIYYPGIYIDTAPLKQILSDYHRPVLRRPAADPTAPAGGRPRTKRQGRGSADPPPPGDPLPPGGPARTARPPPRWCPRPPSAGSPGITLVNGGWQQVADDYVFDTRLLTNHQPYFAAYIKVKDLLAFTDRLDTVQDEWGYLLLWATLGIATVFALTLVLFPVIFGWRTIFSRYPGKAGTMLYFLCLGLGYIIIEVGMISHFVLALATPPSRPRC
jgi:hypothetical protein